MLTCEITELAGVTFLERRPAALLGRSSECELLDELVSATIAGHGSSLVIRGEAGSGKSTLLEYLSEHAAQCRVMRVAGIESERALPFAGLQRLCTPALDRLDSLPVPQRAALATAFGLERGEEPDRFLVGVGVHTLLALVADERPLLCVVDDAHWLDQVSAETLAFVARRLSPGSVGLVAAVSSPAGDALNGLPELALRGLDDGCARALFDAIVPGPFDEQVRGRIIAEAHGNPRALLGLLSGVTPDELAGGFGLLVPRRSAGSGDELHRSLESVPAPTRQFVLLAAAEPTGSAVRLWRAAAELGISVDAAARAAAEGILELRERVVFLNPLARAAAYRAAPLEARREVHRALALAADSDHEADWRAWHRAHAAAGPDEEVADELERAAARARARGGTAAVAAFLERAAELTPFAAPRVRRALAAAESKQLAGAPDAARRMLALAESGPRNSHAEAQALALRGRLEGSTARLLAAARQLEATDPEAAREAYLDAFVAALASGGAHDVARAAQLSNMPTATRGRDVLLAGLTELFLDGYAVAAPTLTSALRMLREELASGENVLRWLPVASRVAHALGDDEAWDELTGHALRAARAEGALGDLPAVLNERMAVEHAAGNLAARQELAWELEATVEHTAGPAQPPGGSGGWSGSPASEDWVKDQPAELWSPLSIAVEYVEAAVRVGDLGHAAPAVARLGELAAAGRSDWMRGTLSLCRALLVSDDVADELYREAIDHLGRTRMRFVLARAELLYGEWLRRRGRRIDARAHLRTAHELLVVAGADGFAERARRELVATGETVRKRVDETRGELTPQETEIASLAADGHTNTEIGAKLFLSPRTVEWHLRKIYPKLGVASRRELRRTLPSARLTPVAA